MLETDPLSFLISNEQAVCLLHLCCLLLFRLLLLFLLLGFVDLSLQLARFHVPQADDEPSQMRLKLVRIVEVHSRFHEGAATHLQSFTDLQLYADFKVYLGLV